MNRIRAAAVLGTAAAITVVGAGSAFAWPAGSITLSATCEKEVGKMVLTVGDTYTNGADFTLTNSKTPQTVTGHVAAKGSATETVPYTGAGAVWTATVVTESKEKITVSTTLGSEPACLPPTPSPTPTPTPSPSHSTPAPSPTPTHSTAAPAPSATPSTTKQLAFTGVDDPALPLGASVLLVGGGIGAAFYSRRAGRRA